MGPRSSPPPGRLPTTIGTPIKPTTYLSLVTFRLLGGRSRNVGVRYRSIDSILETGKQNFRKPRVRQAAHTRSVARHPAFKIISIERRGGHPPFVISDHTQIRSSLRVVDDELTPPRFFRRTCFAAKSASAACRSLQTLIDSVSTRQRRSKDLSRRVFFTNPPPPRSSFRRGLSSHDRRARIQAHSVGFRSALAPRPQSRRGWVEPANSTSVTVANLWKIVVSGGPARQTHTITIDAAIKRGPPQSGMG